MLRKQSLDNHWAYPNMVQIEQFLVVMTLWRKQGRRQEYGWTDGEQDDWQAGTKEACETPLKEWQSKRSLAQAGGWEEQGWMGLWGMQA